MTATATAKIEFKPAVREAVGLWIQLVGGSGSGKTFSALRLASGIAGDRKFAFIDTENRRGLHYADQFNFDYAELKAPFRPATYADAIKAADAAGYPVIVIDSMSHEWAGDGGVLDWHEEELQGKGGGDNQKMAAWIKPKAGHKKLVTTLLQVRAHLIVCFRAEPKIEIVREGNKTVIQEKHSFTGLNGWVPVSEKNLPFEATCSFMLMPDNPGLPLPIKLQEQHKAIFPQGHLIDEDAGKRLAEWAKGGDAKQPPLGDLTARRDKMLKFFDANKVTPDRYLAAVNKLSVDDLTEADIDELAIKAKAIKDGMPVDEAFPVIDDSLFEDDAERASIRDE